MGRKTNPLLLAFGSGERIETTIAKEVGNQEAGLYVGYHTSDRPLTEIEAQTIGLRIGQLMTRYGIIELHLNLERD